MNIFQNELLLFQTSLAVLMQFVFSTQISCITNSCFNYGLLQLIKLVDLGYI